MSVSEYVYMGGCPQKVRKRYMGDTAVGSVENVLNIPLGRPLGWVRLKY